MLTITVPGNEFFNEETEEFVSFGDVRLSFEHSLSSLSKWETIWEKAFLGNEAKTTEEVTSYIKCMCLTPDVSEEVFSRMTDQNLKEINVYINRKMTATWFQKPANTRTSREVTTAELIYYWMFALDIPMKCEDWHLSRLFTLIEVVNVKRSPAKKRPPGESADQRRALNESRKKQFGTTG